jgi:hypothetical protein
MCTDVGRNDRSPHSRRSRMSLTGPKPVSDGYELDAAKGTLVVAQSLTGEEPLLDHFLGGRIGDLVHQVVDILGVNSAARARP